MARAKKQSTLVAMGALGMMGAADLATEIVSKAKSRCMLYNCETKKSIFTQFNPTDIPTSQNVNYTSITSPGLPYPITFFTNGEAMTFSIELFYYDDPYTGRIKKIDKFLKGLMPPIRNKKSFKRPPAFKLLYGDMVMKLVLTGKSITEDRRDSNGRPILRRYTLNVRRV